MDEFAKNELSAYNFRAFLREKFAELKSKNKKYSLRAFAFSLNADPSTLQKIINGSRPLGSKTIHSFGKKLGLDSSEIIKYIEAHKIRRELGTSLKTDLLTAEYRVLGEKDVELIKQIEVYAILELLEIDDFILTADNISSALEIDAKFAESLIELLKIHNWIEYDSKSRKWKSSLGQTTTNPLCATTKEARTELMKSIISKSLNSYLNTPREYRSHYARTFAIDRRILNQYIEKVRAFTTELEKWVIEHSQEPNEVYQIQFGMYPISNFYKQNIKEK